jgi:cell division protein FtsL
MAHFETARINELIGLQIGIVKEEVRKLTVSSDVQVLEADVRSLEKAVGDLKKSLAALPH